MREWREWREEKGNMVFAKNTSWKKNLGGDKKKK
jgi:hypothetical protein